MKKFSSGRPINSLFVGVVCCLLATIAGSAAPGGGGISAANTGAQGGAVANGASGASSVGRSGGNGFGGAVSGRGQGSSSPVISPSVGSFRGGSPGFSGGRISTGRGSGGNGGFNRPVSPGFSANAPVASTGLSRLAGGRASVGGYPTAPVLTAPALRPGFSSRVVTQPSNAWSEARGSRIVPAARAGRYGYNGAYDAGQTYLQNRLTPGQHLSPGASDYSALSGGRRYAYQGRDDQGRRSGRRDRVYHHHYSNPYFYSGLYYPYFYGGSFPGYYGSYDDNGFGASVGVDSSYGLNVDSGFVPYDAPTESRRGYWDRDTTEQPDEPAADGSPNELPEPPAQVGPANPAANAPTRPAETGPDTLVESVQSELARRGYFAGKVDAMYGESTKEALRRFQADRKLAVTGRINEATLHALQLD